MDISNVIKEFEEALLDFDRLKANEVLLKVETSFSKIDFINKVMVKALHNIGEKWNKGEIGLSQVYLSGKISEEITGKLLPKAVENRKKYPKMAVVTFGDYHLLGKKIVYAVLRAAGYDPIDYYQESNIDSLVERTIKDDLQILMISVLIFPSALKVKIIKEKLRKKGCNVKVVVGGAPFKLDKKLADEIEADEFGETAVDAIKIVEKYVEEEYTDGKKDDFSGENINCS